jgi:hypothetical protein
MPTLISDDPPELEALVVFDEPYAPPDEADDEEELSSLEPHAAKASVPTVSSAVIFFMTRA